MKKIRKWAVGGIRTKVFSLILLTVILISAAFLAVTQYQSQTLSALAARTRERQQESISQITSSVMEQTVDQNMYRITQLEAQIADELFSGVKNRVEMLADYARQLFADPDGYPRAAWAAPDPEKDGTISAQLVLADGVDASDPALADRLGLIANMSDMMISLFGVSDVTDSCFIALPEGAFLITDDRSGAKLSEDGSPISYDCRTRFWYTQALEEGGLIFTDVELDAFTGDVGIVCAMPVYVDGRLEAVVGSDLFLTAMRDAVTASDENGGFMFVINQKGHVVFSPKTEGLFRVVNSADAPDLRKSTIQNLGVLVIDSLQRNAKVRLVTLEDGQYFMTGAPLRTVGWALISVFDHDAIAQPAVQLEENVSRIQEDAAVAYRDSSNRSRLMILILVLSLLFLLGGGALLLGRRIVSPLNTITNRIAQLGGENLEFRMEDAYRTGDEIQVLAESFATLSHKTVEYVDEVRRVTAEKERIGTELQMANQIQESMLPSIFPAFPDRPEFDIYATMTPAKEVGGDFYDFFLIDEDHLCMVMADVSGKGVPAALFMMASKIILQSCAMMGKSAAEILTKTNEAICSNNRMKMFVSVWLGILEISTGKVTAANAGHEYPAVMRGGRFELLKDRHGLVIGGMDGIRYREYTLQMEPGDKLFLYTDGVPEATDAQLELFGTDRMIQALNRDAQDHPDGILGHVREAVDSFVGEAEQFDDLTMLCMEYRGTAS